MNKEEERKFEIAVMTILLVTAFLVNLFGGNI